MKLQTRINYRFLLLLLLVFMVAGVVLYFVLGLAVNHDFDNKLKSRSKLIKQDVSLNIPLNLIAQPTDKTIRIKPVSEPVLKRNFADTLIAFRAGDLDNFRKMVFGVDVKGQHYRVTLLLSKYETEDMIGLIFYFMLALFAFIVLILFFLNRMLSTSLWSPFYTAIDKLNVFKIDQQNDICFERTNIYEFEQLNESLTTMMHKIQSDFNNLKEFTENASHEIQTPIAIIKSKLENILQDKTLKTKQYEQIQLVYESANRLSKLNEALLLLSKIENQQFPEVIEINLSEVLKQRLEFIEEIIEFKNIKVILYIDIPFIAKMNSYLAEILINNLLSNAIKHNIMGGQIEILSTENKLVISNAGKPLTINPNDLFRRFNKHNAGNESTGLGLSIVSEICAISRLSIQYKQNKEMH